MYPNTGSAELLGAPSAVRGASQLSVLGLLASAAVAAFSEGSVVAANTTIGGAWRAVQHDFRVVLEGALLGPDLEGSYK